MFGLTFEKLVVVGLFAAVILGPQRLPVVVAYFAGLVGGVRRTMDAARVRAAAELGVPSDAASWRALDPRQYDPRRIIAEALATPVATADPAATATRRVRGGTSAHPRWILVTDDDADIAPSAISTDDARTSAVI